MFYSAHLVTKGEDPWLMANELPTPEGVLSGHYKDLASFLRNKVRPQARAGEAYRLYLVISPREWYLVGVHYTKDAKRFPDPEPRRR